VQTWEYLQIHVESSKGGRLASVYGKDAAHKKEFRDLADLMGYLNSLGAEGWEMVNADRNEYGFQNYFFKRLIDGEKSRR
jgi:hypothetical protein